jgi:hypothetical protein
VRQFDVITPRLCHADKRDEVGLGENAMAVGRALAEPLAPLASQSRTAFSRRRSADGQPHACGTRAAHSPVFTVRRAEVGGRLDAYLGSFERVWAGTVPTTAEPCLTNQGSAALRELAPSVTICRRPTRGFAFNARCQI